MTAALFRLACALSLAVVTLLTSGGAALGQAQVYPFCRPGSVPSFQFGFAELKAQIGELMGEAAECEHPDPATGDVLQRTTTGLAFYRQATNTPTYTNGSERWGLTVEGLLYWAGASNDPDETAVAIQPLPPRTVVALPPALSPFATLPRPPRNTPGGDAAWSKYGQSIVAPAALWPAFESLQARQYSWALAAFSQGRTQLEFADLGEEAWGAYSPSLRLVLVHMSLRSADADTVAALLAHEATHVADFAAGRLNTPEDCFSTEARAIDQEAAWWRQRWGARGKLVPSNAYEQQLNFIVAAIARAPDRFGQRVREVYTAECTG